MEIYFFNTIAHSCKHFIGYCVESVAENGDWQMFAENLYRIALGTRYSCHVYHCHVHADIAHIRCLLAVDEAVAATSAEMAVKAVGIAYRDGGNETVALQHSLAAVAHGLLFRHLSKLENGGLQSAHGVEYMVVAAVDSVEAETEPAGVELAFGEVLYAGAVADVAQDLVVESLLEFGARLVEEFKLVG